MALDFMGPLRVTTRLIAALAGFSSLCGVLWPATYARDAASMAAQGVGQDWVNLLVAVPVLLTSMAATARGGRLASLVYGGALFYFLYSFVIYAFGVHFNRLFLVYCAVLGLSLYAFVLYAVAMARQPVAQWFTDPPVRLVAGYLAGVALLFAGLWLSSILPAIALDSVPREVRDYGLLVNPVHVLDLSVALPGTLVAAALLRRGVGFGFVLASVALVFMALLTLALAGMVVALVVRGVDEDFRVAIVFGALTFANAGVAARLLKTMR